MLCVPFYFDINCLSAYPIKETWVPKRKQLRLKKAGETYKGDHSQLTSYVPSGHSDKHPLQMPPRITPEGAGAT
jgi:hypothetical protein